MKVTEVFTDQLRRWRKQGEEAVLGALAVPGVTTGLSTLLWLSMGYALGRAKIGDSCTPFGIGLVGAAGPGLGGAAALLGACTGGVAARGLVEGLRYAAVAILVYAVSFGFYDTKWFRLSWFLPAAAGGLHLAVGIPLLSEGSSLPSAAALLLLEGALTAASVWCFRRGLFPKDQVPSVCTDLVLWLKNGRRADPIQAGCLCFLGAALLSALAQWQVAGFSPPAAAALSAAVLLAAYVSPQAGICAGVLFGFACDLALGEGPYHIALFTLSAMGAGLCGRSRRGRGSLCAVTAALLVTAAWPEAGLRLVTESLLAALVLVALPRRWFRSVRQRKEEAPFVPAAIPAMTQVRQQLEAQSHAFRRVYDQLRLSLSAAPPPAQDPMLVFQRASERVCVSCIKYHRCWRQQRGETRSALTAAYPRLLERGQGTAQDFPPQFVQRCAHFSGYLGAVNQELSALLAQRQYAARLRESRWAVCSQYGEVAELLSSASSALSARPEEDKSRTRRLEDHLRRQGIPAQGRVIYDSRGHWMVELLGRDLTLADTPELIAALSPLLSLPLRRGERSAQPEGQRLTLVQREPYTVSAGIASLPRAGNTISGDTCRWYKGEDGILRVILCDGMGCGPDAARESGMTLRLVEAFLQGGLEPESALRTVCSALDLRGELAGGYSTIDLLTIDLFSCRGDLYKLGAAPSYLCRGDGVHRIAGGSLPAGSVGAGQSPAITHLPLAAGDTLLLISDGVSDGLEDDWLRRALLSGRQLDARSLALAILNQSGANAQARDDQTAVVLRIARRLG